MDDGYDPYDPYGMFDGAVQTRRRPGSEPESVPAPRPAPRRARTDGPRRTRRPPAKATPTRAPVTTRRSAAARSTTTGRGGGGADGGSGGRSGRAARRGHPFRRLRAVLVVFAVLFAVVIGRLAQLQVVDRGRLEALGEEQRTRSIEVPADRGSVLDRHGNDLALSLPQPTVWADPSQVEDVDATAAALAPILGRPVAELEDALASEGEFAYLARQIPDETAERVDELNLAGIHMIEEQARFHPAGDLLRSVLGSVDRDSIGTAGLEDQYDGVLTGDPGELVVERDPSGRTIPGSERDVVDARAGDDLVLTIDRGMQYAAERALAAQIEAMGAQGGMVIASDPRNGDILAMANLEVPEDGGPAVATANNMALTNVFEPGSVNKVITLAAALEEGVVSPTSVLTVPDEIQVSDHLFTDSHPHATESWTPTDILAASSNVGTIMLARELGPERIDSYLRRFGFGERTALDFPNESGGILSDIEDWSGTDIGSIPIGQGIAVTAVQMLSAYNVIANDGEYVEPRLVLGSIDAAGDRHDAAPSATEQVVSETTADAVRDMMVAVVDGGTGQEAAIDGYSVAGKTGTARKPQANGTYEDAAGNYHYVTTFAGFVPAQDPRLSIIVVIDEPSTNIYASEVAAPVFAELARYGLRQFRIPPPAQPQVSSVPEPTVVAQP